MEVIIKGTAEEIAALVVAIQERQGFVAEMSDIPPKKNVEGGVTASP